MSEQAWESVDDDAARMTANFGKEHAIEIIVRARILAFKNGFKNVQKQHVQQAEYNIRSAWQQSRLKTGCFAVGNLLLGIFLTGFFFPADDTLRTLPVLMGIAGASLFMYGLPGASG